MAKEKTFPAQCDAAIRFFIFLLIFWVPYSPAVVESCVVLALFLWVIKRSALFNYPSLARYPFPRKLLYVINVFKPHSTFLNKSICIFVVICAMSAGGSAFWEISLRGFVTKTLEWFIVFFLVVESFTDEAHFRWALKIFLVTTMATCIDGLIQFYITHKDIFCSRVITHGGATAGFKTYNNLGGYLTVSLPVIFAVFLSATEKRAKLFCALFLGLAVWTTVVTLSRGTWLGILGGILLFIYVVRKQFLFYFLVIFTVLLSSYILLLLAGVVMPLRLGWQEVAMTFLARVDVWSDSVTMILDRPFFGHGPNTFMMLLQAYRAYDYGPTYAHNCYLQLMAEVGIFGLTGFLYIILSLFEGTLKIILHKLRNRRKHNLVILGLLCGIFAFLIQSFLDTNLYSLQLVVYFWAVAGLLVGGVKILNNASNCDIKMS